MNNRIKILIPYDGSKNTEIALEALRQKSNFAREEHEVLVVVSDVWLPETAEEFARSVAARRRKAGLSGISSLAPSLRKREEERVLSREAGERVPKMFPSWKVRVETLPGFSLVSSEILETAARAETDIIVIGTENVFAAVNTGYGAGALRVAREAGCSVHLARAGNRRGEWREPFEKDSPVNIVVVLDGSARDGEIIQSAARRRWPKGSRARIVSTGTKPAPVHNSQKLERLRAAGLIVSTTKPENGLPSALVASAFRGKPDFVFLGDYFSGEEKENPVRRKFRREIEEILGRTKCSIEIVRKSERTPKILNAAA